MVAKGDHKTTSTGLALVGLLVFLTTLTGIPVPVAAGPVTVTYVIELTDALTFELDQIITAPGANVTLHLRNVGQARHTFTLYSDVNVSLPLDTEQALFAYYQDQLTALILDETLEGGEERTVNFTAPETVGIYAIACMIPGHARGGMVGSMVVGAVGGLPAEEPEAEQGIPLRAYWIGLIGIFAMIAVIGVAYFAIKSESRHHTDQREHRRRGLP